MVNQIDMLLNFLLKVKTMKTLRGKPNLYNLKDAQWLVIISYFFIQNMP